MPDRRSAPTLESVAAVAGVSRATAGRVLSGSTTVGESARDAVLRAADELGYVTNRAARALMTRRSGSVAFVVAEPEERFFADPHFALVLRGAHAAVAEHDVQLVFSIVHGDAERERFERFARAGHLDGVILVSLHGDHPLPRTLAAAGIPVMLLGRPMAAIAGVGYVDADNVHGGRLAAARLADGGRTRLATISGARDMTVALDREEGFRAELAARGLDPGVTVEGDFSMAGGRRAMDALLARPDGSTACSPRATSWRWVRSSPSPKRACACPTTSPSSASTTCRSPRACGPASRRCASPRWAWAPSWQRASCARSRTARPPSRSSCRPN